MVGVGRGGKEVGYEVRCAVKGLRGALYCYCRNTEESKYIGVLGRVWLGQVRQVRRLRLSMRRISTLPSA